MRRRRRRNPPLVRRRPKGGAAPSGRRRAGPDPTARRLAAMDEVLLDPRRLYDATLCSPDEFDFILHLYEEWVERNGCRRFFRGGGAGGRAGRGAVHPRHALLMQLADKKANVPMEMLADLFGTDIGGVGRYLAMADDALREVLSGPQVWDAVYGPGESGPDPADDGVAGFDIEVPTVFSLDEPERSRTAENYPGLLAPGRASGRIHREDAKDAGRRVEEDRAARAGMGVKERLKQYRRLTDPYTGYPGLDGEAAVIMGLENFHLVWDQVRRKNQPLLRKLAGKRDGWGAERGARSADP